MKTQNIPHTGRWLALTLAVLLLGATCALAQAPGQGQGKNRHRGTRPGSGMDQGMDQGMYRGTMFPRMAAKLNLTEEQKTAIKGIHDKTRQENLEIRKDLLRLRNTLKGEMLKDDPQEKTVLDLTAKIGTLRTRMQANRAKARLAVRKLLTPEQRDMMLMMKSDHHRGSRGGARQGRGDRQHDRWSRGQCDGSGPGRSWCVGGRNGG